MTLRTFSRAIGGMVLSTVDMMFAAAGYLPPVAGAIWQEIFDVVAVSNAHCVAVPPKSMIDLETLDLTGNRNCSQVN